MRMKKRILLASLVFVLPLALTGCDWFADKEWKEKFGTPELFLEKVDVQKSNIRMYNDSNDYDYGDEVKTALLEAAPFEKTTKKTKTAQKYFTYYQYGFCIEQETLLKSRCQRSSPGI